MAIMTRRLQILIDEDRFRRLAQVADDRGASVATLVRAALDRAYALDDADSSEAAEWFLARPPADLGDWDAAKELVDESSERFPRP